MATSFTHQVGGHASTILSSPLSSSTLIKPSSRTELDFYQSLGPSLGEFFNEWCPAFYGTLKLQGKVPTGNELSDALVQPPAEAPPEMLVLENLTHKFRRPNVLDVKLGQVLYDEASASPEKIERMKRAAEKTTSGELGLRLTGFQVWDHSQQTYVQTPKPFGRTLLPTELDLGISRFFYPLYTSLSSIERSTLSTSTLPDLPLPPTSFPPTLPKELLLPILRTFVHRLNGLSKTLEGFKGFKMRGASLLIVIEGDPEVLEKSLTRVIEESTTSKSTSSGSQQYRDQIGEVDDEEEEEEEEMDDEGNAVEESLIPFEIKLIDFAHTTLDPKGEEHDKGVVVGVENLKEGLRRLIERLENDREIEGSSA